MFSVDISPEYSEHPQTCLNIKKPQKRSTASLKLEPSTETEIRGIHSEQLSPIEVKREEIKIKGTLLML